MTAPRERAVSTGQWLLNISRLDPRTRPSRAVVAVAIAARGVVPGAVPPTRAAACAALAFVAVVDAANVQMQVRLHFMHVAYHLGSKVHGALLSRHSMLKVQCQQHSNRNNHEGGNTNSVTAHDGFCEEVL